MLLHETGADRFPHKDAKQQRRQENRTYEFLGSFVQTFTSDSSEVSDTPDLSEVYQSGCRMGVGGIDRLSSLSCCNEMGNGFHLGKLRAHSPHVGYATKARSTASRPMTALARRL